MKKLLRSINTKNTRSVLAGLSLALVFAFGASLVSGLMAPPPDNSAQPYIGGSALHRIGSVAIGSPTVPDWISNILNNNPDNPCIRVERGDRPLTCLDVVGGATFANLLVNHTAYFFGLTTVGGVLGESGGPASLHNPMLIVKDIEETTNDSILVSGLGNFDEDGVYDPRDLTTERTVCATGNGTLVACEVEDEVSYSWQAGPWSQCSGQTAGSCSGSYTTPGGSCSGTPTQGIGDKVDWNGIPFDWEDGRVYKVGAGGNPEIMTVCASEPNLPYDHSAGTNFDYNASWNASACIIQDIPYTWPSVVYEPSTVTGMWHRINTTTGAGSDNPSGPLNSSTPGYIQSINLDNPLYETGQAYRARCDMNSDGFLNPSVPGFPAGGSVDEAGFCNLPGNPPSSNSLQIGTWQPILGQYCATARQGTHATNLNHPAQGAGNAGMNVPIPPAPGYPHLYMQGYACIDEGGASCNGTSEASCESVPGCNWNGSNNIQSCAGPLNATTCTSQNPACSWNPGNPGTQTRTVVCKDDEGTTVPDQVCIDNIGPKPPTSQSCGALRTGSQRKY